MSSIDRRQPVGNSFSYFASFICDLTMFEDRTRIKKAKKYRSWKPLNATDFSSLMYPCLFINWILGLFPYRFEDTRYTFSKVRFTYSMITMISYVISLIFMIYDTNFTSVAGNTQLAICTNLFIFLDGTVIIGSYIYTVKRLNMLRKLSDVSSILTPKDFGELAKFIHAKDILGFFYLMVHVPNCFKSNMCRTLQNFSHLYIVLANFYTDMFYVNCVLTLKSCFKRIDKCLEGLQVSNTCDEDTWTQKSVSQKQKNSLLLMKLKELEEVHMNVSDVVELLNNTFILRNIIVTISTFILVTFNLYFFMLYSHDPNLHTSYFWYGQYGSPAIFYMTNFAFITWVCETATRQGRNIKTTLYDVFGNTTDPAMKREVQLFSFQVLHRNNIFTAKAIDMDMKLLLRITGGIFMYIMILMQFLLERIAC